MGAVAYIGLQNLWLWRQVRGGAVHMWTAIWCVGALGFQMARLLQLHAGTSAASLACARVEIAAIPLLVLSLVAFANEFAERPASSRALAIGAGASAVVAALALSTDLFLTGESLPRQDWFGRAYLAAPARPTFALFAPVILAAAAFVVHRVRGTRLLEAGERRVLLGGLLAYAGLGVFSVASAMRIISAPMLAQYGPLVVAVALNHLLVNRHRRLQTELATLVEERTTEIATINRSLERRLVELTAARDQLDHALGRLAESEVRYRELVEDAPLGVVSCGSDGRVLAVNPCLVRMLGAPSEAAVLALNLLESGHYEESGVAALFRTCLETGAPVREETRYRSEWGAHLDLRAHLAVRRDAEGRVVGVQAIVEDISEQRALEQRLRQSQKIEAVGRVAAGIAHEINNPMAYVRTNLGLLRREIEELSGSLGKEGVAAALLPRLEECASLIDESQDGVDRTIAIVRDVRAMSHGGDGVAESADLAEVVEKSLRAADPERGVRVAIECRMAALPPVRCSPGQLQQVLVNLLVNAFQAVGEEGRVAVEARLDGNRAVVRVEDDGPGIADDVLERICDPFFTTKPAGQGTGLGLYMAHEIARIHGGALWVDAERRRGAAFELRLPVETG